ncbi:MAG: hypothetical protein R3C25_05865 [Hyphomonadaceae bacterium]
MKNFAISAMALAAVLVLPSVASADDASDRSAAIRLCRGQVEAQAGAGATVRLDQARVRGRSIRIDLDVWRDGQLQNIRCDVARGQELTIAAITPAVQTASLPQ